MFTRIRKNAAKKLFATGKAIYLCPCKIHPSGMWNQACLILGKEYLTSAERYVNHPDLWKGTIEETAWALMYNSWSYYNATAETGYYAHYYIER